jgi:hypothetical protein
MFFQTFTPTAPRGRQPCRLVGAVHREAGGPGHVLGELLVQRDGHALLLGQRREVGVVDVDRQHLEVLALCGLHEGRVGVVQVLVDVDLRDAAVVGHRVAGLGRLRGEKSRPGKQGGNGGDKVAHQNFRLAPIVNERP